MARKSLLDFFQCDVLISILVQIEKAKAESDVVGNSLGIFTDMLALDDSLPAIDFRQWVDYTP